MSNSTTHLSPAEELQSREALAQMLWTGGIIGFFLIQAIIWSIAIAFTHNDPSHAVIADLDERTGSWDRRRNAQVVSDQLGWETVIAVTPRSDATTADSQRSEASRSSENRNSNVQIRFLDQAGNPVVVDHLEVIGFHRSRVTERKQLELEPVEPGVWRVVEDMKRAGWWRFEGEARRGSDRYQFRVTEFLEL